MAKHGLSKFPVVLFHRLLPLFPGLFSEPRKLFLQLSVFAAALFTAAFFGEVLPFLGRDPLLSQLERPVKHLLSPLQFLKKAASHVKHFLGGGLCVRHQFVEAPSDPGELLHAFRVFELLEQRVSAIPHILNMLRFSLSFQLDLLLCFLKVLEEGFLAFFRLNLSPPCVALFPTLKPGFVLNEGLPFFHVYSPPQQFFLR